MSSVGHTVSRSGLSQNESKTITGQDPHPSLRAVRPTVFACVLFFLLFSGPPSLRLRSPEDSLEGVIDTAVALQITVWIVAGIWTLYQFHKEFRGHSLMTLDLPNKLGLVMIFFLGLSTFVSDAPLLTAFKVGQMFVSLLFTWIFVQRYGVAKCMDYVFIGSTLLCVAIAISAFLAPDLVLFSTDDGLRLRGDPIAVMGIVGTYSTILLFLKHQQVPKSIFWPLLAVLSTLLAFSLTRQAWFLVLAFLVLHLAKRSKGVFVRRLGFLSLATFPFAFLFYILPALEQYRSTDSIWSLTGRIDLWFYLVQVALTRSAWFGLGYYSASRVLALDFNSGMGTAHSMLVEVFLGGGLLSLIPCLALCILLTRRAFRFLSNGRTDLEHVCGTLFVVTMALGLMGGDFGYGQVGITFWSLAAAIPAISFTQPTTHVGAQVRPRFSHTNSIMPVANRTVGT
jgi:hypothetical protein